MRVTNATYTQCLDLAAGVFLLAAVGLLWLRQLTTMITTFAVQGVALATIVLILAVHDRDLELTIVAIAIGVLRVGVLPYLVRRALRGMSVDLRRAVPQINVAASLLAAALLVLLSYAVTRPLVVLAPSPATAILPIAVAVVLIGLFALATRRRALAQVVGFLVLDNGITATAFLAAGGVPLIVELGVSFDLLLVVLVLQLLSLRLAAGFATTDLDDLRELRD